VYRDTKVIVVMPARAAEQDLCRARREVMAQNCVGAIVVHPHDESR
jgi:hypothetical protein